MNLRLTTLILLLSLLTIVTANDNGSKCAACDPEGNNYCDGHTKKSCQIYGGRLCWGDDGRC